MKKLILILLIFTSSITFSEILGAKRALQDNNLTLEKMLKYSLEDEYIAKNEYDKIIKTFGQIKPFTNIIQSEKTHIYEIITLMKEYNLNSNIVNENEIAKQIKVPLTLIECYEASITAEIDNIAMYEKFLKEKNLPKNLEDLFIKLSTASKNHLNAFKRQLGK